MKVLLAAHTYWPEVNGVAEVVRQIATRLAARGHDVHVATRLRPGLLRTEVSDGVNVTRFAVSGKEQVGVRGEVEAYRAFVKNGGWDAVEIHCAQSWPLDALLEMVDCGRARRIFVGHGLSEFGNPAWAPYFERVGRALARFDRIVALSGQLEESDLCRSARLPAPEIVPNAVDLEEWNRPPLGVRDRWGVGHTPWIVSVSNHSPVKDHGAFFEVVARVKEAEDVRATIIGGPYPAERWGLGHLGVAGGCWYSCRARRLLRSAVTLRPDRPREEVVSAVQEADVILVTSRREAAPLVVLEAQAAGTPWVAFDVGSIRENEGGIVVRTRREMVDVTLDLLRRKEGARELGQAGRDAAAIRGGWERVAARHEALCRGAGDEP